MLATKVKLSDENTAILEPGSSLETNRLQEMPRCPIEFANDNSEIKKPTSTFVRWLLMLTGTLSLATGIIGIFIPVLPTTCFLLLAAWCYARSSQKCYDKLMNAKYLGKYLKNYRDGKGVAKSIKIVSISLLWLSISFAAFAVVSNPWVQLLLLTIAAGVSWHILKIPTLVVSESTVTTDTKTKITLLSKSIDDGGN